MNKTTIDGYKYREYDFPNAIIKVFEWGKCIAYPKWSGCFSYEISREAVLKALKLLKEYRT